MDRVLAHQGRLYKPVAAYQIPFGGLVPRRATNLPAPVPVSSSHGGFCALRLEPIWMSLGQAAGHAVHLARTANGPMQQVPVPALQARLHGARPATIYVSDTPPSPADFATVQWWARWVACTASRLHRKSMGNAGRPLQASIFELSLVTLRSWRRRSNRHWLSDGIHPQVNLDCPRITCP